jgi:hypothetical protein
LVILITMSGISEKKESPVSALVGIWTGVAVWIVIMTAFRWWLVWWAYFPLIGVVSGAVRQTANHMQNRKLANNSYSGVQPSENQGATTTKSNDIDGEPIPHVMKNCPNCDNALNKADVQFCPACGFKVN